MNGVLVRKISMRSGNANLSHPLIVTIHFSIQFGLLSATIVSNRLMVKTTAPMSEPSHIVHFALRAEAAGQNTPNRNTQVIGGAMWAMMAFTPLKMLS